MCKKILAGTAAVALAASCVAFTPAQAHWHHHRWGGPLAGFAAGAILGGALAAQRPYYYDDGPDYYYDGPAYAYEPGGSVAYCEEHFKSYNPETGMYLGYDGHRHPCP